MTKKAKELGLGASGIGLLVILADVGLIPVPQQLVYVLVPVALGMVVLGFWQPTFQFLQRLRIQRPVYLASDGAAIPRLSNEGHVEAPPSTQPARHDVAELTRLDVEKLWRVVDAFLEGYKTRHGLDERGEVSGYDMDADFQIEAARATRTARERDAAVQRGTSYFGDWSRGQKWAFMRLNPPLWFENQTPPQDDDQLPNWAELRLKNPEAYAQALIEFLSLLEEDMNEKYTTEVKGEFLDALSMGEQLIGLSDSDSENGWITNVVRLIEKRISNSGKATEFFLSHPKDVQHGEMENIGERVMQLGILSNELSKWSLNAPDEAYS